MSDISAGNAYVEFGAKTKGLDAAFGRISRQLSGLSTQFNQVSQATSNIASSLLKVGASIAIPLAIAGRTAVDFQTQMSTIQGLTGATGEEFGALKSRAEELGASTSYSASQVAEAMVVLARQGRDTNGILEAIAPTLNAAKVGAVGLADAAELIGGTSNAFGGRAFEEVGDIIAQTTNSSSQGFEDVSEALKYVATSANLSQFSLEQVGVMLGLLADQNLKGSIAGTSLNQVLSKLSDESTQRAIGDLGVTIKDSFGNLRDPIKIVKELGQAVGGLDNVQKLGFLKDTFDERAFKAVGVIMSSTNEKIDKLSTKLANSKGVAQSLSAVIADNLGGSLDGAKSAVEGLGNKIIEIMTPALRSTIDEFADATRGVINFAEANPVLVTSVLTLTGSLLTLGITMKAVSVSVGIMSSSLKVMAVTANATGKGVGFLVGRLVAMTAPFAGLGAGATIMAKLGAVVSGIGTAFTFVASAVGAVVATLGAPFLLVIGGIVASLAGLLLYFKDFRDFLGDFFSFTAGKISDVFGSFFSTIGDKIAELFGKTKTLKDDLDKLDGQGNKKKGNALDNPIVEIGALDYLSYGITKLETDYESAVYNIIQQTRKLDDILLNGLDNGVLSDNDLGLNQKIFANLKKEIYAIEDESKSLRDSLAVAITEGVDIGDKKLEKTKARIAELTRQAEVAQVKFANLTNYGVDVGTGILDKLSSSIDRDNKKIEALREDLSGLDDAPINADSIKYLNGQIKKLEEQVESSKGRISEIMKGGDSRLLTGLSESLERDNEQIDILSKKILELSTQGISGEAVSDLNAQIKNLEEQAQKTKDRIADILTNGIQEKVGTTEILANVKVNYFTDDFRGIVQKFENESRKSDDQKMIAEVLDSIRTKGFSDPQKLSTLIGEGKIGEQDIALAQKQYQEKQAQETSRSVSDTSFFELFGKQMGEVATKEATQSLLDQISRTGFADQDSLKDLFASGDVTKDQISEALDKFKNGTQEETRSSIVGTFSAKTASAFSGGGVQVLEKEAIKSNQYLKRIAEKPSSPFALAE